RPLDCRSASGSASRTPTPPDTPHLTSVQQVYRHLRQSLRFASRALPQRMPIIALEGLARPESGKRRADHGIIAAALVRMPPCASLGLSRGLGEERAHEWTKGLATARRACKLSLLVLPNRQGESHRTLAFVTVVFVHGHRGSSDWPAPRSVTRTKRSDTIPFRSPGKSQCGECHLLNDLVRPLKQ